MFLSFLLQRLRAYRSYRQTVRELSLLSDRDLNDVGIARYEIEAVARQHSRV